MIKQRAARARDGGLRSARLYETERLRRASWAFTTRRVPRDEPYRVASSPDAPRAGDLVLARVDLIGHHGGLQLTNGRRKSLYPGDEIVVAYGSRYAPNQFEAVVPKTLGPCHLVAGGGVAGKALSWHGRISRGPTLITPAGLLLHADGRRVSVRDHGIEPVEELLVPGPPVLAVVGTAMDAGKTESAAYLIRGLLQSGLQVASAKVTGTGAGGDLWRLRDAGADPVLDFTDAGFVSTYQASSQELERILVTLLAHLYKADVGAVVLEIADGVLQQETAALLESQLFRSVVAGVLFVARDSMGASAGVHWLRERGLPVAGLSGVLTAAPLQRAEAAAATGLESYDRQELSQPRVARRLLEGLADRSFMRARAG